jgi:cell division protein FtsA
MKDRLIAGLDLGSSHIRLAVGQVTYGQDKHPRLNFIAATELPSQGIAKGGISSLEDAVSSISSCLEQAERMVGMPLNEATVGVGGMAISSQEAKGVIGVSRSDGEIRAEDVARAVEAARAFINPANQEIIHILPRSFSVDGQVGIKDPIGMQGIRLEVDTLVVQGLSSHVRNLTKAVFRTGLDISYLVYNPVAVAEAVTTPRQRELGVCILTIGASTTGFAVYENGELLRAVTLPVGADHITSDIAIGLRVSYEAAERIKVMHGTANAEPLPKRGVEIDLVDYGAGANENVSLRYIAEIIEARVEEIFEKAEAELKKIDREGLLPAGVVLTGGGAKLPGMVEVGKRVLRLPCAYAMTTAPSSMPELIQDPAFSTAVGLVLWTYENERREDGKGMPSAMGIGVKGSDLLGKLGNPIKKIFKSFIP